MNLMKLMKAPRLTKQQKREQAVIELLNQMFVIAGHSVTYEDIKGRTDNWWTDWTMTTAQADQWKAWGVEYLRKNLKINKTLAEKEMQWINVQWGLKYSDWNEPS
jgi:hypothetical protein